MVPQDGQRDDCIHIHTDYRDVPPDWLGQDLIDSAEVMRQADEKQYRWVWLGQSMGVDEVIYYMFSDRHKVKPQKKGEQVIDPIGGDYGQQNATTFQAFGLDEYEHRLTGLDEYSFRPGIGKQKALPYIRKGFHYVHGPTA